jgi:hypothetical protein
MRVLVISEGQHELGRGTDYDERSALKTLVVRIASMPFQCHLARISDPAFRANHGKGDRYFKKAVRCIRVAQERGYDAVAVVIDQDDDRHRHRQFNDAQDYVGEPLPRALGVAVRTFDAWMLADEQALSKAIGRTIQQQPDPEEIDDPKAHCRQLRTQHGLGAGLTQMYEDIARHALIDVIERRCPKGFAVFAERVRGISSPKT